jgi:hypothetical protein
MADEESDIFRNLFGDIIQSYQVYDFMPMKGPAFHVLTHTHGVNRPLGIFALNPSVKKIKWHLKVGSPLVSSPLLHNGILIAATYDSWIKDTSFTG